MILSALIFVILTACINDAVGHHIREQVYQKMCAETETFKDDLVKCFSEMPKKDQMILQLCGSVMENEPAGDFNALMDVLCKNATYASKVVHCVDHISHMLHHFNENSNHRDHDHGHDDNDDNKDHDHDHDDDDDKKDHHHDYDHHNHHFDFGHGVYNEECFQRLYNAYNITTSKEDDK